MQEKINELNLSITRHEMQSSRRQIVETSISGQVNTQKMEAALNDWLTKVEEQIN